MAHVIFNFFFYYYYYFIFKLLIYFTNIINLYFYLKICVLDRANALRPIFISTIQNDLNLTFGSLACNISLLNEGDVRSKVETCSNLNGNVSPTLAHILLDGYDSHKFVIVEALCVRYNDSFASTLYKRESQQFQMLDSLYSPKLIF